MPYPLQVIGGFSGFKSTAAAIPPVATVAAAIPAMAFFAVNLPAVFAPAFAVSDMSGVDALAAVYVAEAVVDVRDIPFETENSLKSQSNSGITPAQRSLTPCFFSYFSTAYLIDFLP